MKKGNLIFYIAGLIVVLLAFLAYQYLFRIYESTVEVEPENLFADNQSTVTINVIPLNAFGWKPLFRSSHAEFEITEGEALVEIISITKDEGEIILKAKSETGKVIVKIKSEYSLLPMVAEINILPNLA